MTAVLTCVRGMQVADGELRLPEGRRDRVRAHDPGVATPPRRRPGRRPTLLRRQVDHAQRSPVRFRYAHRRTLANWHCPHAAVLRRRRQMWIKRRLLSTGQTDRRTDVRPLHRPCVAAGSVCCTVFISRRRDYVLPLFHIYFFLFFPLFLTILSDQLSQHLSDRRSSPNLHGS